MNKNKIFLLAAVTALTGGALVGVAAFTKTNGFSFAKAAVGDPVAHEVTFTKDHIKEWTDDEYYGFGTLSYTTEAGNKFESKKMEAEAYGGLEKGGDEDPYLFKLYSGSWPYYKDSDSYFYIKFEMEVDVAYSVLAKINYTVHYDDGSSQSKGEREENLVVTTEIEGLMYELEYLCKFEQAANDYMTIDSIYIKYSCTY